jgi:hypothetical protein
MFLALAIRSSLPTNVKNMSPMTAMFAVRSMSTVLSTSSLRHVVT